MNKPTQQEIDDLQDLIEKKISSFTPKKQERIRKLMHENDVRFELDVVNRAIDEEITIEEAREIEIEKHMH
jgi:hypothetical protein